MKKNIIIILTIVVLAAIGVTLGFIFMKRGNEDSLKFKEEYESLNGVEKSSGGSYRSLNISEDNPIVYADVAKILEVIDNEDAIIYIGANWCPWCRLAVPVLLDTAKKMNVEKIYYLNLDDIKSLFEIKDGEVKQTREGTTDYYKLLDKLDKELQPYTLTDDEGKEYDVGEKRIYQPFVLGVKNGSVVKSHTGTTDLDEGQTVTDDMTEKQYNELQGIYEDIIGKALEKHSCKEGENCD